MEECTGVISKTAKLRDMDDLWLVMTQTGEMNSKGGGIMGFSTERGNFSGKMVRSTPENGT